MILAALLQIINPTALPGYVTTATMNAALAAKADTSAVNAAIAAIPAPPVTSVNGAIGSVIVPAYTDTQARAANASAITSAVAAVPAPPVTSVNGATGAVSLSIPAAYTDAQAKAVASTITSLTSPNISMPNGANLAHTIFQSRPSGGFVTISGTTEQTIFSATGDGSLTIQPVAMFVGARFHLHDRGRATTGLANVSTITARLKLGGTTVVSGVTLGLPTSVSNIPFWSDIDCKILSVGASGSMLCYGALHYGGGAASAAVLMTDLSNATPVTINTTIAQTWDATVQLSSIIGSPSIIIYDAFIIQEN